MIRLVGHLIVWLLVFVPTYIGLGIWDLVGPESALEKLITIAILFFFLGGLQIASLLVGIKISAEWEDR